MLDILEREAPSCGTTDARAPVCSPAPRGSTAEITPKFKFSHGGARTGAGRPRAPPPRETWIGPRWCVYQTHPQAERLAANELTRAGYRSYLPLIADLRRDRVIPTLLHKVLMPRFRGYGFVELGPTDPWVPIRHSPGVRALLLNASGRPAPIACGVIELHMQDDNRLCDLTTMPTFSPGTLVTIEDGALTSFRGKVLECSGTVTLVEVNLFGRLIPTRLARAMLAEASPDST
jgi:transcription antitermination factor NusG